MATKTIADQIMRASIVVAVLAVVYGFIVSHSPPPDPDRPALSATASEIFADFAANAIDAENKYAGRQLTISGPIGLIRETITGRPTLEFHSTDGHTIRCEFTNSSQLDGLRVGQDVVVSGHCRGTIFDLIIERSALTR